MDENARSAPSLRILRYNLTQFFSSLSISTEPNQFGVGTKPHQDGEDGEGREMDVQDGAWETRTLLSLRLPRVWSNILYIVSLVSSLLLSRNAAAHQTSCRCERLWD